jgi:hypothetical protein
MGHGVTCTAFSANKFNNIVHLDLEPRRTKQHGIAVVKIREARVGQMTHQVGTDVGEDESFMKPAFALWARGPLATAGI